MCKPRSPDLKKRRARGCSLWRSLLERPPPALESRIRDPLGIRTSWDGADRCRGMLHTHNIEQYIGIHPRGLPLAIRWMCFIFPRDASAAVSELTHLLAHLLGYFKNQKDLSIWQPKAEKSKKRRKRGNMTAVS